MKPHKWHKEICAWADGAEIEWRWLPNMYGTKDNWRVYQQDNNLTFFQEGVEYRIKPQPKEPQYLYVYKMLTNEGLRIQFWDTYTYQKEYIGKIKLEVDDE
jgi:hypothetical protein